MLEPPPRWTRHAMALILVFVALSLLGHYVADTVCVTPENAFSVSCSSSQFAPFSDMHLGFMLPLMATVGLLLTLVHGLVPFEPVRLSWTFPPPHRPPITPALTS